MCNYRFNYSIWKAETNWQQNNVHLAISGLSKKKYLLNCTCSHKDKNIQHKRSRVIFRSEQHACRCSDPETPNMGGPPCNALSPFRSEPACRCSDLNIAHTVTVICTTRAAQYYTFYIKLIKTKLKLMHQQKVAPFCKRGHMQRFNRNLLWKAPTCHTRRHQRAAP